MVNVSSLYAAAPVERVLRRTDLDIPQCDKGIGWLIASTARDKLIDGVRVEPQPLWPDDRGHFIEVLRVGITSFAQEALGDVVYVSLPAVGDTVAAGDTCGEVESTKSVSDLYAPVSGEVTAINGALDATPELVNSDPYGEGWMYEIRPADAEAADSLLDVDTYTAQLS